MSMYISVSLSFGGGDLNSSENMVIITQLREELEKLKKQVIIKDQQILERDKKVSYSNNCKKSLSMPAFGLYVCPPICKIDS